MMQGEGFGKRIGQELEAGTGGLIRAILWSILASIEVGHQRIHLDHRINCVGCEAGTSGENTGRPDH